ncbi:MAG TPA: SPOR domain-containing protein [Rhodocyclaceae bacterium]|nr:SPOR domain-containing protein [Rhodocyclaceae bacterium]
MNESLPESDDQLTLKKRARRRLIGAIVFVSFAAVVLPMVMDEEAPPATPSIELNIPAQDKGFVAPPTGVSKAVEAPASVAEAAPANAVVAPPAAVTEPAASEDKPAASLAAAPAAAPVAKPAVKPPAKAVAKPESKPAKLAAAKPAGDAKRAQALLEGKAAEPAAEVPHVVLIGAFADPGNVHNLQKKLGELGLKVYTEPLESPQGKKTRVRAGPFPNRQAAERAVARMKAIGVGGVVAPKS